MNEAARLIAESLLGMDSTSISIGGGSYPVYPPTIKVICRAIRSFAKIDMDGEYTRLSVIAEVPGNMPHIIRGLAELMVGDVRFHHWKTRRMRAVLRSATLAELHAAAEVAVSLIGGNDFFACAAYLKNIVKIAATQK